MIGNEWNEQTIGEWGMDVWQPEEIDYEPSLNPSTEYSDVTKEEIERIIRRLEAYLFTITYTVIGSSAQRVCFWKFVFSWFGYIH